MPARPSPSPGQPRTWFGRGPVFGFTQARVRTPTVIQVESVECGAACLGIVLGYHGRYVPLEELRALCGVSRDGSRAANILKGGQSLGFKAKGVKKDIPDLQKLTPPYIVFWNFNHFVVVEGFGRNTVYINDPAKGPTRCEPQEFREAFTGIVLLFEKTPAFKTGGRRPSMLSGLTTRLRGHRTALLFLMLATLALAVPNLVVPLLHRVYIDSTIIGGQTAWLKPLLLLMAITAIVKTLATHMQQMLLQRMEMNLAIGASSSFFWHILRLPITFFSQRLGGEIASRIQVNDRVAVLLSGELATNLVNLLLVGTYAALMFAYDHVLTALSVGVALVNLVVLQYVGRMRRDLNRRRLYEKGRLTGISTSGLQIIETIKATGGEPDYFANWAGHQATVVNSEQRLNVSSALVSAVPSLLTAFNAAAILGLGGVRVVDGVLTMGLLIAFQALMTNFIGPVNGLVGLGNRLQDVQGDLALLDDVLNYPIEPALAARESADEEERPIEKLEGYLELRNVTFGYSALEPPLITDLSLSVRPGQRVALVGGSGSGKSTVAKLVAGLYQPWSGEILFDHRPAASVSRATLTASLAMVDQDICLFEGSVRQNLTLWDATVPESALVQASKDACIHDDVAVRTGGYDSDVEEGGRNFSGGQRQRMEIARALVENPRVLVLDEATSALDANVEQAIQDQLRQRGCTCLIVAHRLSTIRDADEIIVLEAGKVVQRGQHEDMIAVDGPYARLVRAH